MIERYRMPAMLMVVALVLPACGGTTEDETATTVGVTTTTAAPTTTSTTQLATTATTTPEPPPPAILLPVNFDGEGCTYDGPAELAAGPAELSYTNLSDGNAWIALNRHTGDATIQDAIDHFGESPSSTECPSWKHDVIRAFVKPGETRSWGVDLDAALYHMVCYLRSPLSVWFGAGLTVTE